jgi:hypothetical protein
MSDANLLKDVIVPVCAIVGASIGIWNFITALVERRRGDRRKDEDDLRFVMFCHQQKSVSGTLVYSPAVGSEDHLWAERMVERGKFSRMGK